MQVLLGNPKDVEVCSGKLVYWGGRVRAADRGGRCAGEGGVGGVIRRVLHRPDSREEALGDIN